MSKIATVYVCSNCDAQSPKWTGRCLDCGAWGTLQLQTVDQDVRNKKSPESAVPAAIMDFSDLNGQQLTRLKTNISEFDRVLGGGIVPGSLVLLSGEPGIGKSTIVAQIAAAVTRPDANQEIKSPASQRTTATSPAPVIYVSGEESLHQVKVRLDRLNCDSRLIKFINETNAEKILAALNQLEPKLVIIDSIQTVYSGELPAEAGSLNQIRASAVKFLAMAKEKNLAFILIGHITKDGLIAGPKSLEHIVDTVIYLEPETSHDYRLLRASKNRFGSTNELGIFRMTGQGFKEIANPAAVFIDERKQTLAGSTISSLIQGSRPFLLEIQALVSKTVFGYPQRKASGFDLNRLQVLAAVISKRTRVNLNNQDIILNIVGGLKANEPALDLAVALAIISSLLNQVIDKKTIVIGEVGLGGEVRQVARLEDRLKQAAQLGFNRAIVPELEINKAPLKLIRVKNLAELIERLIRQ